jgi:transcription initiation factor TFIIH subunit 3|mmetsp:Transcript_15768/g.51724  ORF Transcript_15768/g.51724 Transcript_15768/m.51724 type:complete len:298 (+) Transcript_15768:288-1181(+)|eukprot:CAMPEP_0119221466 /NCGR_PEP_ID=MMETSP1327-20130426/28385_1 /TAXON_ID=38833 /ORGANISM="Micromonas pusilla, Strain RCC2306" /LENGTH=297 /DNA_ID=CAMNT_0007219633 /DNA_START=245 /DNA_END=1138 /DNA_ORIENTATION=+
MSTRTEPGGETYGTTIIVVLETNPFYWQNATGADGANGLGSCLRQILVFINAHLSLSKRNDVAVLGMHSGGACHFLYESSDDDSKNDGTRNGPNNQDRDPIQNDVSARILRSLAALEAERTSGSEKRKNEKHTTTTALASALSMSMCYANRTAGGGGSRKQKQTRVVVVQGSADFPGQYVPVMNAIFSAQRAEIQIDSCILGDADSAFLQQAAHITGGLYYKVKATMELTQSLLQMSGADSATRKILQVPNQRGVDFRASCFCHKQPLETGFVCSVCLSIYCKECARCQTCEAEFDA